MTDLENLLAANDIAQLRVIRNGETLWSHDHHTKPVDVFAVQKGLVALLIGIAQERYLLEIDENVNHHHDPEWTRLGPWDEAKLSLRSLMTMTTGMDDDLAPLGEIDRTWRYNNTAYQVLKRILEYHTGLDLQALSAEWIFDPLGMTDTHWVDREQTTPDGRPISALYSTAADLAHLGEAVRGGGAPIINESFYLDELGLPGSEENPAWGLLWWNNNQSHHRVPGVDHVIDGPVLPGAPADLLMARGALGNHLGISRETGLTVAFTIKAGAGRDSSREARVWALLSEAHPF